MSHRLSAEESAQKRKQKREEKKQRMDEERKRAEAQKHEKQERLKIIQEQQIQLELLETFHTPLYNEIDKLNKKAPKEQISDYTLTKINEHIEGVKALLPDDPYLSKIHPFEAAGDNPEYRDVALALAEIGASLKRFKKELSAEKKSLSDNIKPFNLDYPDDFSIDY